MSKSEKSSKDSGAHSFNGGKNHEKPAHTHGPVETGKHEKPARESGAHDVGKPIVHKEVDGKFHSGRKLPKAIKPSNALKGSLEKRDE